MESTIPDWIAPTISGVSAVFAAFALWTAIKSNRRSDKVERINQFEREYGAELRALFRKFDGTLALLDAYIFPSGVSIEKQHGELEGTASALEEQSSRIIRILGEIDDDESVNWSDWQSRFQKRCTQAELDIAAAFNIARSQPQLFQRAVLKAQSEYQSGVRVVRRRLRKAASRKDIMK